MFACTSGHTCRPDVDGFPVSGVFDDFESDIARRAGEGGKLLIGRVEELFCDEESMGRETDDVGVVKTAEEVNDAGFVLRKSSCRGGRVMRIEGRSMGRRF